MAELPPRRKPSVLVRRRLHPTRDAEGRLLSSPAASPSTSANTSASTSYSSPRAPSLRPEAPTALQQLYRDEGEGQSLLLDGSISGSLDRALFKSRSSRRPPTAHEDEISLSVATLRREARALLDPPERKESPRDATFYSAVEKSSPSRARKDGQPASPPSLQATPRRISLLRDRFSSFHTPADSAEPESASSGELSSTSKRIFRNASSSLHSPQTGTSSTSSNGHSDEKAADESSLNPVGSFSPPPREQRSPKPSLHGSVRLSPGGDDSDASQTTDTYRSESPSRSRHAHEASLAAQIALPPSPAPQGGASPACDSMISDSDLSLRPGKTVPYSSSPLPAARSPPPSSGSRQWGAAPIASPHPSTLAEGCSHTWRRATSAPHEEPGRAPTLRTAPGRANVSQLHERRGLDLRRQIGRKAFSQKATLEPEVSQATLGAPRDSCSSALHEVLGLARDLEQLPVGVSQSGTAAGGEADQSKPWPAEPSEEMNRLLQRLVEATREAQAAFVGEKEQLICQLEMEVRRGDTLAEALAVTERDTERRLLSAREQARSEARQSFQAHLDPSRREDIDGLTRAYDERDAARTAIARAIELADKADAARLKMRDALIRAEQERDEASAQMREMERRLVLAERTQTEVEQANDRAESAERRLAQVQRELQAAKSQQDEHEEAQTRLQASLDQAMHERDDALHSLDEQGTRAEDLSSDLASIQAILDSSRARAATALPHPRGNVAGEVFSRVEDAVPKEMIIEENHRLQELLDAQDRELNQLRRTGGLRYVVPSSVSQGPTTIRRYDDPLLPMGRTYDDQAYTPMRSLGGSRTEEDTSGAAYQTPESWTQTSTRIQGQTARPRLSSPLSMARASAALPTRDPHLHRA